MVEVCALISKAWTYKMDDDSEKKKAKGTKEAVIKRLIMYEDYTYCLFNDGTMLRSQKRFKSNYHDVYTEEVNTIALSSDDDKRSQAFDKVTAYPNKTNAFKVCDSKTMVVRDLFVENYEDCQPHYEIILQPQR